MPQIDLGSVVGPQGPQGVAGATGAQGVQGNPGPNQITISTNTNLGDANAPAVLTGNGSTVTPMLLDSVINTSSAGIPSSQAVLSLLGGVYSGSYSMSGNETDIRIASTNIAVYLFVMVHRSSGDRAPYVAVVSYVGGEVSLKQLTTNANQLSAAVTTTGGTATGFRVITPGYMSGVVLSSNSSISISIT